MTDPIHITSGYLLIKLPKMQKTLNDLFCIGINTKTRPIDPDLTIRMMMDCIITFLIALTLSLRRFGETGHLMLQC